VSAAPHSINALPGVSGDERTADKLVNGRNDECGGGSPTGADMWLAPYSAGGEAARVYLVFDDPITISLLKAGWPGAYTCPLLQLNLSDFCYCTIQQIYKYW
jgi:hypothetical protein